MSARYLGQRVVILGLGRQGVALARFLALAGARVVVSDVQPAEKLSGALAALSTLPIEYVLGHHPDSLLDGADLVCLSGGIPLELPIVSAARRRGLALSNDSQIFLEASPPGVTVVGITGSAGKTTTTHLVGRMLAAEFSAAPSGRVWIGGNIGSPLIADVDAMRAGDRAVMELSSFQLELMTRSPQVAGLLNVTPNHLDRHGTLDAYAGAKSQILRHQGPQDVAVLGWDDPGARAQSHVARGRLVYFSAEHKLASGAWLAGETLMFGWDGPGAKVCTLADIELRGRHNVLNVLAALALSGAAGASAAAMADGLRGFRGVEHRLELVRERHGVKWYNDSIATAPERVVAALNSFDEQVVLLLGGRDKQLPWQALAELARERTRAVVLFGEAADLIARALQAAHMPAAHVRRSATLEQAVSDAASLAQPGDVVLLSPGGTSYDAFQDFAERGERFRGWVNALD